MVEEKEAELSFLKLLVDKLKLQVLRNARARFGASSEQLDDPQIARLVGAPLYERPAPIPPPVPDAVNAPQIDRRLPAHLPRESQVYRPEATSGHQDANGIPCGCTSYGGRLRLIGRDVSEQLEYVPSRFKVIRHVRPKLACVACETIFQALAPSRPIARGMAGPGLVANVLVSKYCDHIPLHRLHRIYARDGVVIDPSTMGGWVGQCDKLFDPLLAALGRYTLAGEKVHADDTPVAVLDPGRGRAKTRRLWVYVRDDRPSGSTEPPAAWYRYSPNRRGEHPHRHLANYRGILQADAYGGYGKIYTSGRVVEAACWAHARRPFWDLHQSQGKVAGSIAHQALQRIAALYKIEAQIRGQPPDVRQQVRQARAGPLLDDLHAWLTSMLGQVSRKSELAKVIGYSLEPGAVLRARLRRMLRMYCLQQWCGLADEELEDALYDSQALRDFVGIDLSRESVPDATTLLKFRRLLLANDLTKALFEEQRAPCRARPSDAVNTALLFPSLAGVNFPTLVAWALNPPSSVRPPFEAAPAAA